ncbi:hypothetical protein HMN09_00578600 [Mycena chlorophos]|uniref:Uncharacterized protein n=1 Tax=Mycena chlorophos TaxID=658473 RepID=A0A8H6WBL1_MYCCL|nr:hypothetical protein HMN09_00578600 [Mycena chlorophos]
MPEQREAAAHALVIQWGLDAMLKLNILPSIQKLYYDPTFKAGARLPQGKLWLARELPANSTIERGTNGGQTLIWPCLPCGEPLSSLVLRSVDGFNRGLVMDFTLLFLQASCPNVQWYTIEMWEDGMMQVAKDVRRFSVVLAIRFADRILAFVSNDLVAQLTWSTTPYVPPPNIYDSPGEYLGLIAAWIECTFFDIITALDTLIGDQLRADQILFQGLGKYTVDEVCFLAGISPFESDRLVFTNPSRTARLFAAMHAYFRRTRLDLPFSCLIYTETYMLTYFRGLIRPALIEGVFAPTDRMRENYYTQWIHVSRKDTIEMSARANETLVGNAAGTHAYDVYETSFVASAIEELGLCHLITGESAAGKTDPVTELFERQGLLDAPTHLRPGTYSPLRLSVAQLRAVRQKRTFTYDGPEKTIWSISPPPANCCFNVPLIEGTERTNLTYKHIINNTQEVGEGPMDYRAHGKRFSIGGKTVVSVCKGDPRISEAQTARFARGLVRRKGVGRKLNLKTGLGAKENRAVNRDVRKAVKEFALGYTRVEKRTAEHGPDVDVDRPAKVPRLSADRRMAQTLSSVNK